MHKTQTILLLCRPDCEISEMLLGLNWKNRIVDKFVSVGATSGESLLEN